MKVLKEVMKTVAEELNSNYFTITEISREMGYKGPAYLQLKAKKLKLGYRIKTIYLLSQDDIEILKKSVKRKDKENNYG